MNNCERQLADLPDEELVRRYTHDHDESAITILYLRHYARLRDYGVRRLGNLDDAKDLVQMTWEAVLNWPRLPEIGDGNHTWRFEPLVMLIARGLVVNWRQRVAVRRAARARLVAVGGQPLGARTCLYCTDAAATNGMCHAHWKRKQRGWPESKMREPVKRKKRRKE